MQATGYVFYILIGSILGMIYGLLFLLQKRGAFSMILTEEELDRRKWFPAIIVKTFVWTLLRLFVLAVAMFYLLPLPTIPLILVLISFFLCFGVVVHKGTR
jgi:hypothetical protein